VDWSSIIYAAIGGGAGGALGAFFVRFVSNKTIKSIITVILVILGYNFTTGLYKNMKLPRIIPLDISDITSEVPAFEILRKNSPTEFETYISSIDRIVRKRKLTEDDLAGLRRQIYDIVESKRLYAPPAVLREQNRISARQFEILYAKSPEICTAQANGRPFPILTNIVGKEFAAEEQKVMEKLFAVKSGGVVGDKEIGETLYGDILRAEITNLSILTLDPAPEDIDGHKKICKLFENAMNKVNDLDDESIRNVAAYIASDTTN
jgi:hypothetical protein